MTWQTIFFIVAGGLLLITLLYIYSRERGRKSKPSAASIAFDAFLVALIMVLAFVPQIGYITIIPGLSFTLVHLPVLLGAYVGGRRKGLFLGTVFGVTSILVAATQPVGLNALFLLPYIAIPPRMIFGYLSGLFFEIGNGIFQGKGKRPFQVVVSFLSSLMHTVLVFAFLFLFSYSDVLSFFASDSVIGSGILISFTALIALGALGEAVLAAVFVPLLGGLLEKATPGFYARIKGE